MNSIFLKYLFCGFLIIACTSTPKAQTGLCPPNLDFENGDFSNWVCRNGDVDLVGGVNTITWTGTGPISGRHTIITPAVLQKDIYGWFPQYSPNGSGYSIKLGANYSGAQAEGVSYTYSIPSTLSSFSILFHYAIVLQNPGHGIEEQPRFRARIIDLSTNLPLPCVNFDFAASSSLPGFAISPIDRTVIYKDWTTVSINLSSYIGKTIMIEFITSDCTQGQHFGYAYVDISSACNGAITGTYICDGDDSVTLTAPHGLSSYKWYSDNTFSQVLSTTQTLTLNPAPPIGSSFPVVTEPYPGFGCPDTLYAVISAAPKPASVAGNDMDICKYQQQQIGGSSNTGYQYSWTPANQVSNPAIANPMAWDKNNQWGQTEFVVKTTDVLTGCFSNDTMILTTILPDTSIIKTGKNEYCFGDPSGTVLQASSSLTSIQWHNNNTAITGATSGSYQPQVSGIYRAIVTQDGCNDTTSSYPVAIYPQPQAKFSPDTDTGCLTNNSYLFSNSSSISDGSALSYLWKFSDGLQYQSKDVTRTFQNVGSNSIKLIVSSANGCKDSATGSILLYPNGIPDFSMDSICVNRPVLFRNLSNENNVPLVNYSWNFDNGAAGSSLKDPLPVTYPVAKDVKASLTMTSLGCENDPQTITKSAKANHQPAGIRYRSITVPAGYTWPIHVRDSVGNKFSWQPQLQLSNYNSRFTNFIATGNDVEYTIKITDDHTCVTTDTLEMQILKKPGYYLPTAFTPNGDGLNDIVTPHLVAMKALKSFSIYNRWGNLLFQTKEERKGWDGRFKGVIQPTDVYVWVLEFVTTDDKIATEKGTITILK